MIAAVEDCSNTVALLEELATGRGLRWQDISRLYRCEHSSRSLGSQLAHCHPLGMEGNS